MSAGAGTPAGKRRIAIIGGGCGGIAAAWGLANSPAADDLEITVYQMGWRLGGKGASGRNQALGDRIEEHGLHIWGGMYENAFAIMRQVYGQLDRPPDAPLSTWYDPDRPEQSAFLPHNYLTLMEFHDGRWIPWDLELPATSGLPGDGRELPELGEYLEMLVEGLAEVLLGADGLWKLEHDMREGQKSLVDRLRAWLKRTVHVVLRTAARWLVRPHLRRSRAAVQAIPEDPAAHTAEHKRSVHGPLTRMVRRVERRLGGWLDRFTGLRRFFMVMDLGAALIRGVLEDGVLHRGFDVVDDVEFTAWLRKHGAGEGTVAGPLVRGWHDFFFAYVDGDTTTPSLSAASALRTLFRYCFTYRGAFFWKMQAGMGDTIFGAAYEALLASGVRFEFFSRVTDLGLSDEEAGDAGDIETIRVVRQVRLAEGVGRYDPLFDVKGLPCWPSEPLWDKLDPEQVAEIKSRHIDLESWWTDWAPETYDLRKGRDFDDVILAVPPPAARNITGALIDRRPGWGSMLDGIETNQTVAAQVWLKRPLSELGWREPSTVGTRFASPMNTWADMDQLLVRESWDEVPEPPRSVLYFCGTATDALPVPPYSDLGFPATQQARAYATAVTWLDGNTGPNWPACLLPGTDQIDWSTLFVVDETLTGEARFSEAYWRLNIEPTERYVLSVPGMAAVRPRAHESGFGNLYLAGDWLYTGINAGCVEAAVMGGLQASQALVGFPEKIVGDDPAPTG